MHNSSCLRGRKWNLQTLLANGIGIVGGLASLGATFDKILTTDKTRTKISEFLKRSRISGERKIFAYLALVNETVFNRFFSVPFLSFRYFLTCAVVSTTSMVVIVALQLLAHGPPAKGVIKFDGLQLLVLFVCFVFNLVIDWISIGQTQVFFAISETQRRLSYAIILIVSDFILTINVFSLLYAQPLAWGLYLYGAPGHEISLIASVTAEEVEVDDEKEAIVKSSQAFSKTEPLYNISFDMDLKPPSGGKDEPAGTVRVKANTPEVFLSDVLSLANRVVNNSVISTDKYFLIARENKPEERRKVAARTSEEWKKLNKDEDAAEKEEVTLSIPAFSLPRSRSVAYSIVYQSVDQVQDGFPGSVLQPITFLSVNVLNRQYHAALAENEREILGCGTRANGQMRWEVITELNRCEGKIAFSPDKLISLRREAQELSSELSNKVVPLNSFFMTSLSVTALLYFAAFFLFLAREIYQRAIIGVSSVEHLFLRSPLAIVGLLVGACVFGVTLIV